MLGGHRKSYECITGSSTFSHRAVWPKRLPKKIETKSRAIEPLQENDPSLGARMRASQRHRDIVGKDLAIESIGDVEVTAVAIKGDADRLPKAGIHQWPA